MSETIDAPNQSTTTAGGDILSDEDEETVADHERTESAEKPTEQAPESQEIHQRDHWRLAGAGAFFSTGFGIMFTQPALLLVAIVCVGGVILGRTSEPPEPTLTISRSFSTTDPKVGEEVTVETTIRNTGTTLVSDCRVVDRVPSALRVTDGSPRMATPLRPGTTHTLEYTVVARQGRHEFPGLYVIASTISGTVERECEYTVTDTITCRPEPTPLQSVPLRSLTTPYAGRLPTTEPGEGTEFYATREYRHGDPFSRLDWKRYAANRELTTVQFRTERSASVTIILDVRPPAYTQSQRDAEATSHTNDTAPLDEYKLSATGRSIEAATRLFVTLLNADHRVGIATFGPEFWLESGSGTTHRNRGLDAFASEPALSPSPPAYERQPIRRRVHTLRSKLSDQTQVIICTPLVDDITEVGIRVLESAGHDVTVLSPDPTSRETPGAVVASLERLQRIERIHTHGVPVIDWSEDETLDAVLARAARGTYR